MSRLAKKPILLPVGVQVSEHAGRVVVHGPKGDIRLAVLTGVAVAIASESVRVTAQDSKIQTRANLGTMWSLIRNAVIGVKEGFVKSLEIQGVGYRAVLEGTSLVLSLGYVNPVRFAAPASVFLEVEKNIIKVSGIDKELVGQAAAKIRALKKPEPYKGKGIRYQGEVVKIKAGKKAATAGSK